MHGSQIKRPKRIGSEKKLSLSFPKGNPIYSFLMFLSGPILANIASC